MATNQRADARILLAVVIYGEKLTQGNTYKTLIAPNLAEIDGLMVFDNSPESLKEDIRLSHGSYVYRWDKTNPGLSTHYNEAARYAQEKGYRWLLLLDQDTTFPSGALAAYRKAIDSVKGITLFAPRHQIANGQYLSPTPYRMKVSHPRDTAPTGITRLADAAPINSGLLIGVDAFWEAGGYDASVWLDFSDVCFMERYRRRHPLYYVLPDVTCTQAFSGEETDKAKVFRRHRIYLECAHNYPRHSLADTIALTLTTLRPTLSRTIKEKTIRYLKAYWSIYILGKKAKDRQ